MTDDRELSGLDPYDLLDHEAARLDAHFSALSGEQWMAASGCAGWTVRDVLCHLAASEEYHHACLEGTVGQLFALGAAKGLSSLDDWNEDGIRGYDGRSEAEALAEWRAGNKETRRRFRARDGEQVDSSVGAYPARWQAFHVAQELATHADDVGAPVSDAERDARRAWRVRVSRFALAEAKPELVIEVAGDRTTVAEGDRRVTLAGDELVAGVAGRLAADPAFDEQTRAMLSTMP